METRIIRDKTHWLLIIILWCAGIGAAMQFAKFSIAFDVVKTHYDAGPTLAGLSLSIVGFVGLIFGASAGVLAARIGYRRVLVAALIVGAFSSIVQAFLPPMPIMLLSRFVEGMSHLAIVVVVPTIMASVSAARHRSLVMGLWGAFFSMGFMVMAWLGMPLLLQQGISILFLAHGTLMICLMGGVIIMLKDLDVLDNGEQKSKLHLRTFIRENIAVYMNPRTFLSGAIFLFHAMMFIALLTFLPRLSDNQNINAFLLVGLPLISIVGTFCAGAIAQYLLSPVTLVMISYGLAAIGAVLIYWSISVGHSLILAATGLAFALGMIQGATFATIPILAGKTSNQARANGTVAQLGNLGSVIGPPVFASIISTSGTFGLTVAMLIFCVCGMAVALYAMMYLRTGPAIEAGETI